MTWTLNLTCTARPSTIIGGIDSLDTLGSYAAGAVRDGSRLFVVTDTNVLDAWGDTVLSLLGPAVPPGGSLVLDAGEATKSLAYLGRAWDWLATAGARRDDTVVALGGGVIGDLAGLVAATYLRGVALWQIPTSLLAQVDSSVGGKTAINLEAGKNLVGAFYQPDLVVVDPTTLRTLPREEFVNGLGEVVKYALLDATGLFDLLEQNVDELAAADPLLMDGLVQHCIAYKALVVEADELDKGRRAVLNLGHTTAHAVEVAGGYGATTHGCAVGLGLLVALGVSERLLGLDQRVLPRTRRLLQRLGLPVTASLPPTEALVQAASRDKKVLAHTSGFVGLREIGDPVWGLDVPAGVLGEALEVIRT